MAPCSPVPEEAINWGRVSLLAENTSPVSPEPRPEDNSNKASFIFCEQVVAVAMSGRPPLAEKALSETYARLRYRDASLLIWQQQQQKLESLPPGTYLNRSHSMWYSQYGNQAILVRDKNKADIPRETGQSRFCSVM